MDVMVSLKTIYFSFLLSSKNAPEPNVMLFDVCTVIFCNFVQFLKPPVPTVVTLSPIVTDDKLLQ